MIARSREQSLSVATWSIASSASGSKDCRSCFFSGQSMILSASLGIAFHALAPAAARNIWAPRSVLTHRLTRLLPSLTLPLTSTSFRSRISCKQQLSVAVRIFSALCKLAAVVGSGKAPRTSCSLGDSPRRGVLPLKWTNI